MKHWIALLAPVVPSLSLCAGCGGDAGTSSSVGAAGAAGGSGMGGSQAAGAGSGGKAGAGFETTTVPCDGPADCAEVFYTCGGEYAWADGQLCINGLCRYQGGKGTCPKGSQCHAGSCEAVPTICEERSQAGWDGCKATLHRECSGDAWSSWTEYDCGGTFCDGGPSGGQSCSKTKSDPYAFCLVGECISPQQGEVLCKSAQDCKFLEHVGCGHKPGFLDIVSDGACVDGKCTWSFGEKQCLTKCELGSCQTQ